MTAVPVYDQQPLSAPQSDRLLGDRVLARYYRTAFAWPAAADPTGVWLRLGDVVDALTISVRLAIEVNRILTQSLLTAPIVEVRGQPGLWVFLTQPRTPLRQSTQAELIRLGIGWREPGSALRLPPLAGIGNGFHWLKCPRRGVGLPPWTAVIGAARSASLRVANCPLMASKVNGNQGPLSLPLS